MLILAIVDIHKSETALKTTLDYIKQHQPDTILILGDITTFGPLDFAEAFLSGLPELPTLALPGNCDPPEILSVIDNSKAVNLHNRKKTIDEVTFVGLGGSNVTPFNTPFELTEDDIYLKLDEIMERGAILALHFPAKGHLDEVPGGVHTGSESALKIIEKYQPSMVISGHIHETRGIDTDVNGIIYLNPGTLQGSFAALIEITPNHDHLKSNDKKRYNCKIEMLP